MAVPCEFCRKTQHRSVPGCAVFLRLERIFASVEVSTTTFGATCAFDPSAHADGTDLVMFDKTYAAAFL